MGKLPKIPDAIIAQSVLENTPSFWAGGGPYEGQPANPWSRLIIDGLAFPGQKDPNSVATCAVEIDGEIKYRIDSQKVKGHDGHKLVADGYAPTQCTALAIFWREEQWAAFLQYLPVISPKIPRTRQKVDAHGKPVFIQQTKKISTTVPALLQRDFQTPLLAPVSSDLTPLADQKLDAIVRSGNPIPVMESYRPSFIVEHPFLAAYGLVRVYINEITFPKEHNGRMVRAVRLSLYEVWDIKPKSTATTVSGGGASQLTVGVSSNFVPTLGTVSTEPLNPTGKR